MRKFLVLLVLVTGFAASGQAQAAADPAQPQTTANQAQAQTTTSAAQAQTTANPAQLPRRDGAHDFDFLIGDWKAHVRRLPDRLNNSNVWVVYDGISNHKKVLDSNSNFEDFNVTSTDKNLHIKAQTLRLYNPTSHQWSIYLVDVDNGTLDVPPV